MAFGEELRQRKLWNAYVNVNLELDEKGNGDGKEIYTSFSYFF